MKTTFFYTACCLLLILYSCSDNDDDTNPEFSASVSIEAIETEVNEIDGIAQFNVELDKINTTENEILIRYTVSGTATSAMDYVALSEETIINIDESSALISINLIDDNITEENETLIITLDNAQNSGISLGSVKEAILTIIDDEIGIIDGACPNDNSISTIHIGCDTDPSMSSIYTESLEGTTRIINTNTYPNHRYTTRTALTEFARTFTVPTNPLKSSSTTLLVNDIGRPRRYFGVALNGVLIAPAPAEPFIFENTETGEYNWDWVFEATNNMGEGTELVSLDCATAHLGPQGYHYHGNMFEYIETIQTGLSTGTVPNEAVQIGWASDGFPILYRYGPDVTGALTTLQPSYQLKNGVRSGDGISAPCGSFSGKYTRDYEYINGLGDLDECNGLEREITLTTAQGEETFSYFYVVTEAFPQISRCISGTADESFEN